MWSDFTIVVRVRRHITPNTIEFPSESTNGSTEVGFRFREANPVSKLMKRWLTQGHEPQTRFPGPADILLKLLS